MSSFASSSAYHPRNAGHRAFKGQYPENSLLAYEKAVEAGVEIIETDIQVTGDGVVVIQHDVNTSRMYGADYDVTKTPFHPTLESLVMVDSNAANPRQKMMTFEQAARLFCEDPRFSNVLLMLDVKRSNEPWIMPKVVEILRSIKDDMKYWATRMVFGIWRLDVLEQAVISAPEIPVVHIGVSVTLARKFMQYEQVVGISILYIILNVSSGEKLMEEARQQHKLIYAWTVNSTDAMKWAISANLDGVITDHPDRFAALLDSISDEEVKTVYARVNPSSFFTLMQRTITYPSVFVLIKAAHFIYSWVEYFKPSRKPVFSS